MSERYAKSLLVFHQLLRQFYNVIHKTKVNQAISAKSRNTLDTVHPHGIFT